MPIRLVDAGSVPSLRSQTIYHGVARAFTKDTPNTIILVTPEEPYLGLGFHQKLNQEINVEFCKKNQIPIVRREVGGGAVYLDENQLFTQWIFRPDAFPMRVVERFRLHAYPIIATYKDLNIDAYFKPVNDIQVAGKKIAGLGAAAIGNAEVVVGNFMFDFNYELMAKALNVSNERFREKVYQSLQLYMTTIKQELDEIPSREMVKKLYLENCEKILKEPIEEGPLAKTELEMMEALDIKFSSEEWLYSQGSHVRPAIKIHSGVWIGETKTKANGNSLRTTVRIKDNHIDDIEFFGDMLTSDKPLFEQLEETVLHAEISEESLLPKIQQCDDPDIFQALGIEQKDWVRAIVSLAESIQKY